MKGKTQNKAVYLRCKQALFSLIHKMPFAAIGVKDIADECGFSRQYFYRFYTDKFDLVISIVEEGILISPIFSFRRSMSDMIRAVEKNVLLYREILESSYFLPFYRLFLTVGRATAIVLGESAFVRKFTPEQETKLDFLFHGTVSMLFDSILTGKELSKSLLVSNVIDFVSDDLKFLFEEEVTTEQIVYKFKKLLLEQ